MIGLIATILLVASSPQPDPFDHVSEGLIGPPTADLALFQDEAGCVRISTSAAPFMSVKTLLVFRMRDRKSLLGRCTVRLDYADGLIDGHAAQQAPYAPAKEGPVTRYQRSGEAQLYDLVATPFVFGGAHHLCAFGPNAGLGTATADILDSMDTEKPPGTCRAEPRQTGQLYLVAVKFYPLPEPPAARLFKTEDTLKEGLAFIEIGPDGRVRQVLEDQAKARP